MGNFDDAVRRLAVTAEPPVCPFCGDHRQIEQVDRKYVCATCSKDWPIVPTPQR